MCMSATCDTCKGKTWRGCGQHIPGVLDSVPKTEWCSCGPKKDVGGTQYPPGKGNETEPAENVKIEK